MALPLLATKLYVPPPRPQLVPRPRLIERLEAGLQAGRKLTLLAAPAGFGKTTLLSDWLTHSQRAAAWLSLDEGDNDLSRFLTYLVGAVQTVEAGLGAEALDLLQARQPLPASLILTPLINAVAGQSQAVVLVLDDYHLIETPAIHEALGFLLDHLPAQLHLALSSRADPPLPLPRLRARGALTEVRAADLRFSPTEAASFLNQVMGLGLAADDVAALEQRTEGWIAGLQMAALSMQGRDDVAGFVRAFTGSHRYIIDYLVEEVLQRQPEPVRNFLLQTSILDRLCGPLCDAVLGQAEGGPADISLPPSASILESLERANLFVVPLDDQRQWYRYHHLFADVLQARLRETQPAHLPALHQRASQWHAEHDAPVEAVRHALAGKDFERAARLMEQAWLNLGRSRQDATLNGWVRTLPAEVLQRRPVLSAYVASSLLRVGKLDEAERRLQDAQRWVAQPDGEPVVENAEEFRRLPLTLAISQAGLAQARGDSAGTMRHAQQAMAAVQPGDHLGRAGAAGFLGLALWARGEVAAAQPIFAEAVTAMHRAGNHADALSGTMALAEMQMAQGRLREARRTLEQAGQGTTGADAPTPRATADVLVALSELDREQNDLAAAEARLLKSRALGEHASLPENWYRWPVAMARLRAAHGDLDGALTWLAEAERLYVSGYFPDTRPIGALRARIWIAQGRLADAQGWAQAQGLTAQDEPSYGREFAHLTLARLLLAGHRANPDEAALPQALDLLERLLTAAEAGGRTGSANEILVLQALAHAGHGDMPQALAALERALTQAEPEGYVRLFMDEGPPMANLLQAAAKRGVAANYVRHLLTAFGEVVPSPAAARPTTAGQSLAEPLSERELQVLRLLRTELSGPEIARELVVSLNTFNTHTKNIYSKLGVSNRLAAIRRAEELNLT